MESVLWAGIAVAFSVLVATTFQLFRAHTNTSLPRQCKRVLLVTAHPDDEVMFFLPFITGLMRTRKQVHILCLSTGNADGLGAVRTRELQAVCDMLQVPLERLSIVDDPDLQDGMSRHWSEEAVSRHVVEAVSRHHIDTVVTFDGYGVSGHANHRDTWRGVRYALQQLSAQQMLAYQLESVNLLRKFSFWLDYGWARLLLPSSHLLFADFNPPLHHQAMLCHNSQYVWFRKLFVLLSRYSYINTLRPIRTTDGSPADGSNSRSKRKLA